METVNQNSENEMVSNLESESNTSVNESQTDKKNSNDSNDSSNIFVVLSYIGAIIFICIGFYKMLSYNNGEYGDVVNAYVGGDAYNYIINANYAVSYFILALMCVINASVTRIIRVLKQG